MPDAPCRCGHRPADHRKAAPGQPSWIEACRQCTTLPKPCKVYEPPADGEPTAYDNFLEEWREVGGWRPRASEVELLLAELDFVRDTLEGRICDLELDDEGHTRFYAAAISVIRQIHDGWSCGERFWWNPGTGIVNREATSTERMILDHAREAPDA